MVRNTICAGLVSLLLLGEARAVSEVAGSTDRGQPHNATASSASACPGDRVAIYFPVDAVDPTPEARLALTLFAAAHRTCAMDQIVVESRAGGELGGETLASVRAERIASVLRILFFGRVHIVTKVVPSAEAPNASDFGPLARRADVRLVF